MHALCFDSSSVSPLDPQAEAAERLRPVPAARPGLDVSVLGMYENADLECDSLGVGPGETEEDHRRVRPGEYCTAWTRARDPVLGSLTRDAEERRTGLHFGFRFG